MKSLNWKVVGPGTLRVYELAAKDYELFSGMLVSQASAESITAWQQDMEDRGLSVNTIRTRLIAIGMISGVKIPLPKRNKECGKTLSLEQVKGLFSVIAKTEDRTLIASIFFTGTQPGGFSAHFAGVAFDDRNGELTTQEITRKVKRYAKLAGLNEEEMNLRTMRRSGKALMEKHAISELVKITAPSQSKSMNVVSYRALHGINRRSRAKAG